MFKLYHVKPEFEFIIERYPEFFLTLSETAKHYDGDCNLRFGFECDGGWAYILDSYFNRIKKLIEETRAAGIKCDYKACILKEKFGVCEDQGDFECEDEETRKRYRELSAALRENSAKTCELTGKKGKPRRRRMWVKTLCDEEAEKLGYEPIA